MQFRLLKIISYLLLFCLLLCGIIIAISAKPDLLQNISFSKAIYDNQNHLLRLTLSSDQKYRLFVPFSQFPSTVRDATLLEEDQYFYWHPGVNPFAIFKAIYKTYLNEKRRFGASTITMQVARLRYKINSKTLSGKLWQIYRAMQLEFYYSKNQILEAYLNLAPYGGNIEGIGAASLVYFDQPIQRLTLPQVLTLAIIPQNPLRKSFTVANMAVLKNSRDLLFLRWLNRHPEDRNKKSLLALPLQLPKKHLPFLAPHFVDLIVKKTNAQRDYSIQTSLDSRLQKILEHNLHRYLQQKINLGVKNAAIMLVDARTMEVKALVGSANFFDQSIQGQINGTQIKRSPGSTLKPFIYALALEQGLIHPYSICKDSPMNFGAYSPDNFDYDFMGPIKAKDALILSRNIPAIYLASQLSRPNLYQFLQRAHIAGLQPESHYGLSLVLGSAEVTMEELVKLYAALINNGTWKSLRYLKTDLIARGDNLLSTESCFLILDILANSPRSIAMFAAAYHLRSNVAWKTGTSSGFRDAWTIGIFGPYVLAVWVGNFDGRSNPYFVGKESAAQLFFTLIEAIETQSQQLPSIWPNPKNLNLVQVDVCEASGAIPNAFCPHTVKTWFIPGKSPIKTDSVFREVMIDPKTGLRACHFDAKNTFSVYEFWPSDLLKLFRQAGLQRPVPPAFDPSCSLTWQSNQGIAPRIISPQALMTYTLRLKNSATIIPFTAIGDADVKTFYWFINQSFIGKSNVVDPLLWQAKSGNYIIRVVDDHGRSDVIKLKIQTVL